MKKYLLVSILVLSFMAGVVLADGGDESDTVSVEPEKSELDLKVAEIFGKSCATSGCHGGKQPKMDLGLEAEMLPGGMVGAPSKQNPELMLIDAEDPSKSYLLLKITGGEGMKGKKMPIMKPPLKEEEIETVREWLNGTLSTGANVCDH